MASLSYTYSPVSSSTTNTTMSATPTSSASAASTTFVALALGRSANAIDLFVPPAPAVHAAADLKARSFDFLADLLLGFDDSRVESSRMEDVRDCRTKFGGNQLSGY
jgi:hypothetical protein